MLRAAVRRGRRAQSRTDVKAYLDLGADKIAINTAAIEEPELITEPRQTLRQPSASSSRSTPEGRRRLSCLQKLRARAHGAASRKNSRGSAEELGAGEILLTSIEQDGSLEGYDNELNARVAVSVGNAGHRRAAVPANGRTSSTASESAGPTRWGRPTFTISRKPASVAPSSIFVKQGIHVRA